MTISKEERAEWRKMAISAGSKFTFMSGQSVLRLLDALEAEERVTAGFKVMLESAKARAEAIENRADEVISDLIDSHRNMEARAEAAERERNALRKKVETLGACFDAADAGRSEMMDKAIQAEKEREVLAKEMAQYCSACPLLGPCGLCGTGEKRTDDCEKKILEWARQQARGGKDE